MRGAAYADLEQIFAWIAKDNPRAAREIVSQIFESIERLEIVPEIGRVGKARGTREWVVRGLPYIVVYAVDKTRNLTVVIGVMHTARDR